MQDFRSFSTLNDQIFSQIADGIGPSNRRRIRSYQSPAMATTTRPPPPLRCPRCDSLNTKFCYYNNYNLSQPRHFCRSCRRYWTNGGVLRNVPVGGSCRKNKRSSSKNSSRSSSGDHSIAGSSPIPSFDRPILVNVQPFVDAPDMFSDLEESFFPDLMAPSANQTILDDDPQASAIVPRSIDFLTEIDQAAYWSQGNWDDADLSLYLP